MDLFEALAFNNWVFLMSHFVSDRPYHATKISLVPSPECNVPACRERPMWIPGRGKPCR